MQHTLALLAALALAGGVLAAAQVDDQRDAADPCTSAFYWEHRDCAVPALVALDDLDAVTGVDVIEPIDRPRFGPLELSTDWLAPDSSLLVVSIHGATKAYPLAIMVFHEVVNDELAGVPLLVTYCPLCNSGIAFDRRVERPDGGTEASRSGPAATCSVRTSCSTTASTRTSGSSSRGPPSRVARSARPGPSSNGSPPP